MNFDCEIKIMHDYIPYYQSRVHSSTISFSDSNTNEVMIDPLFMDHSMTTSTRKVYQENSVSRIFVYFNMRVFSLLFLSQLSAVNLCLIFLLNFFLLETRGAGLGGGGSRWTYFNVLSLFTFSFSKRPN